jgi:hypothetical protein
VRNIEMLEEKMVEVAAYEKELFALEEKKAKEAKVEAKVAAVKAKEDEKIKSFSFMMKKEDMTSNQESKPEEDFW